MSDHSDFILVHTSRDYEGPRRYYVPRTALTAAEWETLKASDMSALRALENRLKPWASDYQNVYHQPQEVIFVEW